MAKASKKARGKSASKKKSGKAKAKAQKKSGAKKAGPKKQPAKKVKKAAKKARATMSTNIRATTAGMSPLALKPNKATAVVGCVNRYMDIHHPGWNADLQGDQRKLVDDFQEPPPLFLDAINTCLEHNGFTIYPVPHSLTQVCATGTMGQIKFAINTAAKPKG